MLGVPINFVAFHAIEVMTQVRYRYTHMYRACREVVAPCCAAVVGWPSPPTSPPCPDPLPPPQDRFAYKRAAFLCASQTFSAKTDVIVLCTQLLKKVGPLPPPILSVLRAFVPVQEFSAKHHLNVGLAVNCLANIATPELAQDLLSDVVVMLTRSDAACAVPLLSAPPHPCLRCSCALSLSL